MTAENVQLRNDWYKDRYGTVLRLAAALCLGLLLSIALNIVQFLTREQPKYFAVDSKGSVIPIVPVDRPFLTSEALAQWAADVVRDAYSLNFIAYDRQLSSLRDAFEPSAFNAFVAEMDRSNLGSIKEQRLILDAVTRPAVVTSAQLAPNGHYVWNVEVPLTVTAHFGGDKRRSTELRVALEIMRVDTRLRPETGVVVTQFVTHLTGRS